MAKIGELAQPKIGEMAKVFLPGESPWAECLVIHEDGTWEGGIRNTLFAQRPAHERRQITDSMFGVGGDALPSLHNFKQDQVVRFKRRIDEKNGYEIWVPAEQPPSMA